MDKRLVMFIVVTFIIWFGWAYLQKPVGPPYEKSGAPAAMTTAIPATPAAVPARSTAPAVQRRPGKDLQVQNDQCTARIRTGDGTLASLVLRNYTEKNVPVDICAGPSGAAFLELSAPGNLDWKEVRTESRRVVLETASGLSGVKIRKEFDLSGAGYLFNVRITLVNQGKKEQEIPATFLRLGPGLGAFREDNPQAKPLTVYVRSGGKLHTKTWGKGFLGTIGSFLGTVPEPADPTQTETIAGKAEFVALCSPYFTFAVVPDFITEGVMLSLRPGNASEASVILPSFRLKPGQEQAFTCRVFGGPLKYSLLKGLRMGLEEMVFNGWFGWLGVWMLILLEFLYSVVRNYGVAIVIMTVIIKAVLWWPTQKSMESMKKMAKIQPHLNDLRSRHKDDPKKLNQETMRLFQEHKVNPMGGCLPLLVQMPVFFALYASLSNAIELREAPFFWWITDLSVRDPYYILAVLMGVTMLYQQWLSTPDKAQFKKMLWMPLVFSVMFFSLPSGVLLYWVVQNILSIGQQFLINRETEEVKA